MFSNTGDKREIVGMKVIIDKKKSHDPIRYIYKYFL